MIRIEIDDREVRAALDHLARRAADLTPAMADIAQALESETERRFELEGPGWPDLAERTILERTRAGTWPGKKLQRSAGGLAASIESRHGRDWAEIGSNKVYAAIHQLGGRAGRRRAAIIPARPYLPLDGDRLTGSAEATVLEILQAHLDIG